jgi:hypothetical protein
MDALLKMVSVLGLALTVVPACLVFAGLIAWPTHALLMVIGMVLWFVSAPFWMGEQPPALPFWSRRRPL